MLKNKLRFLLVIGVSALCLSSCVYEPYFIDDYYVANNTSNPVKYVFNGMQTDSIVQPNEKVLIYTQRMDRQPSPFDNDEVYLYFSKCTFGTIQFNDSVFVTYHVEDTFSKSTLLKSYWEVTKQHKTMGSSTHEVLYTIDEQDYKNALIQCGYRKEE
jgi:hypothetical protein